MFKDGQLLGGSTSPSERNHSNRLLPAIQELMTELKMPMRSLQGIVLVRAGVIYGHSYWRDRCQDFGLVASNSANCHIKLRSDGLWGSWGG